MREKGITTTTLVITTIVLLILAGIVIAFVINSGILGQADTSQEEADRIKEYEELSLAVADYWIMNGDLAPIGLSNFLEASPYNFSIKNTEEVDGNTEQLQVLVRKFTFDVTTEPETDISGGGPVGPGGTIEITEGNVVLGATTCSVTITVTDINIADAKYRYYISEYPDVYDSYIETSRPSHTIENLKQDTQYYVKVEIIDKAGNIGSIDSLPVKTNKVPDVDPNEIMYSPAKTNENVPITSIHDNSEFKLMYKIGDGAAVEYNEAIILEYNSIVTFWLEDKIGQKGNEYVVNVNWIDRTPPKITNITENGSILNILIDYEDAESKISKIALIRRNFEQPLDSSFDDVKIYEVTEPIINENGKIKQTIVVNDLIKNYPYFVWVMDEAGNISEEYYLYCTADVEMTDEISLSTEAMVNTFITAELPVRTGGITTEYLIFYNKDDITEENIKNATWQTFKDDNVIIGENCYILYRYNFFNYKIGDYKVKEITNIDTGKPIIKQIGSSSTSATVRFSDAVSGIDKIGWSGIQASPTTWWPIEDETTWEIPIPENAGYQYVYIVDKVGNEQKIQVSAGDGFDVENTYVRYEDAEFIIEAKDERINELGTDVYWYLGTSPTPPTNLEEYEKVTYEPDERRSHVFTNGIENTEMYVHIRDNNGNMVSTTIKFDKRDKTAPVITYETVKYYPNNEYEDIQITIEDSESALAKILLYNSDGSDAGFLVIKDGNIYLYENEESELLNFVATEGYSELEGFVFLPQTDNKRLDFILTGYPTYSFAVAVSAIDVMENESVKKTILFEGDTAEPIYSYTPNKYYKENDVKLVDATITLMDDKSGLNEITITYVDATGTTQTINKTTEELAETKSISIPITGILHDTDLTITATDICLNPLEETYHVEGDFEAPDVILNENNITYSSDKTTSIMYADNIIININDAKSYISSYSIQYVDKNGITQTVEESGLSTTEEDLLKTKYVTLNNVKPNTIATVQTMDICDNAETVTLTLGIENNIPTVKISNKKCKLDENGNPKIELTVSILDGKSGLDSYTISYGDGSSTPIEVKSETDLAGLYSVADYTFEIPNGNIVYVNAIDICGNENLYTSGVLADNRSPEAQITVSDYVVENEENVIKGLITIKDNQSNSGLQSGIASYRVYYILKDGTEETTIEETTVSEEKTTLTTTYTVPNQSTVYVTAIDKFGNAMSTPVSEYVEDIEPPTIEINKDNISYVTDTTTGERYATNAIVTFTDEKSKVEAYTIEYTDKDGVVQTVPTTAVDKSKDTYTINNFKINSTVKITAVDNFGNSTGEKTDTIGGETNKPTITINQAFRRDENGTPVVDVTVTITDTQSGLDSYKVSHGSSESNLSELENKTDLKGITSSGEIKFSVPSKTVVKVQATDICGNYDSKTITVGDTDKPSIKMEPTRYYKNENGENYISVAISIEDVRNSDSGLYSYSIKYKAKGQDEYTEAYNFNQLNCDKTKKTHEIEVPNDSIVEIVAEDMCNNIEEKSILVADTEGPQKEDDPTITYEISNGNVYLSGSLVVIDNKSKVYQYKINNNEWITLDTQTSPFSIPFKNILNGNELTIKAKDYFGNENTVYSKKIEAKSSINIKNVVISNWDPITNKISGTVDIEFTGKLVYGAFQDLEGGVIKNRTSDVKNANEKITLPFENIDNSFKVVIRNDLEKEVELEIGDKSAPTLNIDNDFEGIKKTPKITANGDTYFDITVMITDKVPKKEIIDSKLQTSTTKDFDGSGLAQYQLIRNDIEEEWIDIPKENGKYKQEYEINVTDIPNLSSLTVKVRDYMGNEAIVCSETIQVRNDIEIDNIVITEWNAETKTISGSVDISALEKGLQDAKIMYEGKIQDAPKAYNGSRKVETYYFDDVPNNSYIYVTNTWNENNQATFGDSTNPTAEIVGVEYRIYNSDYNKVSIKLGDGGNSDPAYTSGLLSAEVWYIDSNGVEMDKKTYSYNGHLDQVVDIEVSNAALKIGVKVTDKIGNTTTKEFSPSDFADNAAPNVTIDEGIIYSVEGENKYISGTLTITDKKSKIESYEIKYTLDGEEVKLKSAEGLTDETITESFKILNGSTVVVTARDNYGNARTTTATFSDNVAPTISREIVEYYKDEYDTKELLQMQFTFKDSKSGVQNYSILQNENIVKTETLNTPTGEKIVTVELENNTTISVVVKDLFGNEATLEFNIAEDSSKFPEKPVDVPNAPEGTYEPTEWTEGEVTVTLVEHEKFTLLYSIDDGTEKEYTGPFKVAENCTIKYRYYYPKQDRYSQNETITIISNIDLEKPIITVESRDMQRVNLVYMDDVSGVVSIAVTETADEPTAYDWEITSLDENQGILSDSQIYSGLEYGKTYYAWAMDASGKISDPVEFTTEIREVATATYTPTEITNGVVTVTLPKTSRLNTQYQIIPVDGEFNEEDEWLTYTDPFTVEENCTIYYRYEYSGTAGDCKVLNITNIDKVGPQIDFAIMIDDTLNLEYIEENKILGYAIKEENVTPTETELIEHIENQGVTSFSISDLTNIEIDKTYYVWLADEAGNISETAVAFKKVKVAPTRLSNGYTFEEVPIEIYVENVDSISLGMIYDEGVNEEFRAELESQGYVEGEWLTLSDTSGTDTVTQNAQISCTVLMKATKGEKTSKTYEIGVHMIDLEPPEITVLEQTITSVQFRLKDAKVGIAAMMVGTSDYSTIAFEEYLLDINKVSSNDDIFNFTEEELSKLQNEWTSEVIELIPNQNYVIAWIDALYNMNEYAFDTMIEKPGAGSISPTEYTSGNVKVTLPTQNIYETEYRTVVGETASEWTTYTERFEVSENCIVEYRYKYGEYAGESATLEVTNIDKELPVATIKSSNSYSVLIGGYDEISGVTGYCVSTEETTPVAEDFTIKNANGVIGQETTWMHTGLNSFTTYYVWVIDKVGNISEEPLSFSTEIGKAEGATVSETEWTNQDITVTLPTQPISTTFTEYQILSADDVLDEDATWTKYTAPFTVSENCVIYYRYNDGQNAGEYGVLNITNIDKVKPTLDITAVIMDGTVNLSFTEEDSGIAGYILATYASGNTLDKMTASDLSTGKITGLSENTTYYIWLVDNADNISDPYVKVTTGTYSPKVYTFDPITVNLPKIEGYTLQYQIDAVTDDGWTEYTTAITTSVNCAINYRYVKDGVAGSVITFNVTNIISEETLFEREGVNPPVLSDGMIPIKHNGTNWVVCDVMDDDWYQYTDQTSGTDGTSKWANVMLSDGYYDADTVEVGTEVTDSQLGSMFVWIPRYAYAITSGYHGATADGIYGTIKIAFLRGDNTYSKGDTIQYSYQGTASSATLTNASGSGNWNEHPAFTFGTAKLKGLWIAKFQASMSGASSTNYNTKSSAGHYGGTSQQIKIQPNASIWRFSTVSQAFNYCYNMNKSSTNVYGINASKSVIDPHLMKNMEWGAMTYLTHSSYGRNGNQIIYIKSAGEGTLSTTVAQQYLGATGRTADTMYKGYTYITAPYTSTTGNVTGIYDIANTAIEWVSAYLNNGATNSYGSALKSANSKYVDIYAKGPDEAVTREYTNTDNTSYNVTTIEETQKSNYTQNKDIYGDAMYEISSDYTEIQDSSTCETSSGRYLWGSTELLNPYMISNEQYVTRTYISTLSTSLASLRYMSGDQSFAGNTGDFGYSMFHFWKSDSVLKTVSTDGTSTENTDALHYSFRPVLTVY